MIEKPTNSKVFGSKKTNSKGLNRIAKIGKKVTYT
jgi:hypothetical protein